MTNNFQRKAHIQRTTKETDIKLELNLDGTGICDIQSGIGFFDHMLTLTAFWAKFDLTLRCTGDTHIDSHHSIEDIGLAFGDAFRQALASHPQGKGICRVAHYRIPMDEALTDVCIDISGRSWLEWRHDELLPPMIAGDEKDIWREFYKSFASTARMNIHIDFLYGKNGHHLLESVAKGFGKALQEASTIQNAYVSSTKGELDL